MFEIPYLLERFSFNLKEPKPLKDIDLSLVENNIKQFTTEVTIDEWNSSKEAIVANLINFSQKSLGSEQLQFQRIVPQFTVPGVVHEEILTANGVCLQYRVFDLEHDDNLKLLRVGIDFTVVCWNAKTGPCRKDTVEARA